MNIHEFITTVLKQKYRVSGDEYETGCPFKECPNRGGSQFYINSRTGAFYCHRCNKKGPNLKRLEFALGLVQLADPVQTESVVIPETKITEWQDNLKGEALEYLLNSRCLSKAAIVQFKLGATTKNGNEAIAIPYFNTYGVCVGVKYDFFRRPSNFPKYIMEKGSEISFFNISRVNLSSPLYITEGEYDAISGWDYGYENIGSVPNGANSIDGWIEQVKEGKSFILVTDNDQAGNECASQLSRRLGRSKCRRAVLGTKDFNTCSVFGIPKSKISEWISQSRECFNAPILDITNYEKDALDIIQNPDQFKGQSTGWKTLDSILGGIRQGELSILSGYSSGGKTTWGMALIANLIKQNTKCLVASPEMRESKLLLELANNYYSKQVNEKELNEYVQYAKGKIQIAKLYGDWTDIEKEVNLMDQLFEIIDYSCKTLGTEFIFIDHLHLFTGTKTEHQKSLIDEFLKKITRIKMFNKCHIMVVVQSRKPEHGQRKMLRSDLKGSSNLEHDPDNIILVHRDSNSHLVEFDVAKNRELGTEGTFHLEFNTESMANYEELEDK